MRGEGAEELSWGLKNVSPCLRAPKKIPSEKILMKRPLSLEFKLPQCFPHQRARTCYNTQVHVLYQ